MDKVIEQLRSQWKNDKSSADDINLNISEMVEKARTKRKSVLHAHIGNIIVLTLTLIMITAFFYYVAPFKELISRIGVGLMVGSLSVRIIIEIYSSIKSSKIDLSDHAVANTESALHFLSYRKKIHGPFTISIVALYTIGFYMLTPEFSKYIEMTWMILMDTSYVVGAVFLIVQIRKGIRKEMNDLQHLTTIKNQIQES